MTKSPHIIQDAETKLFACVKHPCASIYHMTDEDGDLIPFCPACKRVHDMEKEAEQPVVKESLTAANEGKV